MDGSFEERWTLLKEKNVTTEAHILEMGEDTLV